MPNSEKRIDDYIAHFAVTKSGKLLLKRKIRHLLEKELALGKSLHDIDKQVVDKEIKELLKDKPWVSINSPQ